MLNNKLINRKGDHVYLALAETLPKQKQEIQGSKEVIEGIYATWVKLAKYEDLGLEPHEIHDQLDLIKRLYAAITKLDDDYLEVINRQDLNAGTLTGAEYDEINDLMIEVAEYLER